MFFFNSFHYMGFREHQRIVYSLLTLSRTQVVAQTQKNLSDSAPGLLKYLGQPTLKLTHHFSFPLILGYAVYCWFRFSCSKKANLDVLKTPYPKLIISCLDLWNSHSCASLFCSFEPFSAWSLHSNQSDLFFFFNINESIFRITHLLPTALRIKCLIGLLWE